MIIIDILTNKIIYPSLITIFLGQIIKLLISYYRTKTLNLKLLYSMGGMPSTHAASVASLVTALARYESQGVMSLSFGSSFVFAIMVMYDAAGIRRKTGEHAVLLNKVVSNLRDLEGGKPILKGSLTESLGHTPLEVFAGGLFGFLVTWFICFYLNPIK